MTDNKLQIVQEMYAAFGRGDGDAIFARLTDDIDWSTETESTVAPWYGQRVGKESVAAYFEALAKTSEVTEFTPLTMAAAADDVLVVVRVGYTIRATGKSTVTNQHHWWRFRDDKVCFYRGAEDTAKTVELLS